MLIAAAAASLQAGNSARAVAACLAVVGDEPLRESAHRILVRTYAAAGNIGQAVRQAERYSELLRCETGLRPSNLMVELTAGLGGRQPR